MSVFVDAIARTARWVHPDTFRALPVWYPEVYRGVLRFQRDWKTPQMNRKRGSQVREANILAGRALKRALGAERPTNWTVCHIWGNDDAKYQTTNDVVRDPKFYSCVGNMVWLPTPLKGFTDSVPEIKFMMRICAFYTYGWVCQHPSATAESARVRATTTDGLPNGYPESWPRRPGECPLMTAAFTPKVQKSIRERKTRLSGLLADRNLLNFPREQVVEVLDFWQVSLDD